MNSHEIGGTFSAMPLDTTSVNQGALNISDKRRSNAFAWNGQFSPQLVETILQCYSCAGDTILDPFAGSGTVLHECGRLGRTCCGTEINPAAFMLAKVYQIINVAPMAREGTITVVDDVLSDAFPEMSGGLFGTNSRERSELLGRLIRLHRDADDPDASTLLAALAILLGAREKLIANDPIFAAWAKLRRIVRELPASDAAVELYQADARQLPLPPNSVDFVLTSPPYINVFNYHQQYRRSAERFGLDLLHVARSEIGANRKHRGNRFLTVVQYCLDMADVLTELRRVCRRGARVVLVVGRESNVRKTRFLNGGIVAEIASGCVGFRPLMRQERVFKNRFGMEIREDILHFEVPDGGAAIGSTRPRDVGVSALWAAFEDAPQESLDDLRAAIAGANDVKTSPLYRAPTFARTLPT